MGKEEELNKLLSSIRTQLEYRGLKPSKDNDKRVILLLGSQSSGKSAYINNFYDRTVRRTADQEVDTQFSIIESISEEEFKSFATDKYDEKVLKMSSNEKKYDTIHNEVSDFRNGVVWKILNQFETLNRYPGFSNNEDIKNIIINNPHIIKTVLINEKYMTMTDRENKIYQTLKEDEKKKFVTVSKKLILIDSPGWKNDMFDNVDKLDTYHELTSFLVKEFSHLVIFMCDVSSINKVVVPIRFLELILTPSEISNELLREARKKMETNPSTFSFLMKMGSEKIQKYWKDFNKKKNSTIYGTSIFQNVYFVLTQMDKRRTVREQNSAFFEFGKTVKEAFRYLPGPVADNVLSIALKIPQLKQWELNNDSVKKGLKKEEIQHLPTFDLHFLEEIIESKTIKEPPIGFLIQKVMKMFYQIEAHDSKNWKYIPNSLQYLNFGVKNLDVIRKEIDPFLNRSKL